MLSRLSRPTPKSLAAGALVIVLAWVWWPTVTSLVGRWGRDPQYSHGYLVPLFALYLLWSRRGRLAVTACGPSWWGWPLLVLALGLRFAGTYLYLDWLSDASLLPCVTGAFLLVGGGAALRWAWPAVLFLIFMVPLPYSAEVALAHPLQRLATRASTYALQTLGFTAFAEGNVIRLGRVRIGVVEACSGLSMLVIFFALAAAVVLVVRRPWYEKAVIFCSAVPIAIASNVIRITVTGVLHKTAGARLADLVFHDLAGWLMMPLALAILWCELRLLAWLIVPASAKAATAQLPVAPWARAGARARNGRPAASEAPAAANPPPAPKVETPPG